MRVVVTGANGFVGKNLVLRLRELKDVEVRLVSHLDSFNAVVEKLRDVETVFHLAGVNRPQDPAEFQTGNHGFTDALCAALHTPCRVLYASSTQAVLDNVYGASKRAAEQALGAWASQLGGEVRVFRLPNLFGKWCRPNYNSVVATFCHNIAHGLPVQVNDPNAVLTLNYVDDVIDTWLASLKHDIVPGLHFDEVKPRYQITVGALLEKIEGFHADRSRASVADVGIGLDRALHATYLSYLEPDQFAYPLKTHTDPRGSFAEMLKTASAGQFSFFTAHPGITRGGHYHHTKSEKFLVVRGHALFKFLHMSSGSRHQLETTGQVPTVVETVPGWSHDITNIGSDELICLLWANERFDPARPDTIVAPLTT